MFQMIPIPIFLPSSHGENNVSITAILLMILFCVYIVQIVLILVTILDNYPFMEIESKKDFFYWLIPIYPLLNALRNKLIERFKEMEEKRLQKMEREERRKQREIEFKIKSTERKKQKEIEFGKLNIMDFFEYSGGLHIKTSYTSGYYFYGKQYVLIKNNEIVLSAKVRMEYE